MPRKPSNVIRLVGQPRIGQGVVLSDADYHLIASAIGPGHGREVEDFLAAASVVTGGRLLDTSHPHIEAVLAAIGTEVHGYMKLDEERDGRARAKPKPGSMAERLLVVYEQIEQHLA